MFQPRFSRSNFRSGSPFRSEFRSGSPFPEDCADYGRFRYLSPYYDFQRYGDFSGDYAFPDRDCSPWRFSGDYADQFDDYSNNFRFRGSSPYFPDDYSDYMYRSGDYDDYFCGEDGEPGQYFQRRSRAVSRDRMRFDRSSAFSGGQYGGRYGGQYGGRYGARYRSLSPAPYTGGYPAGRRYARQYRSTVRARSMSPAYGRMDCFPSTDMAQSHYMASADMESGAMLRQAAGGRQEVCSDSETWRHRSSDRMDGASGWRDSRQTSLAHRAQAVTGDWPMTPGMTRRLGSRRVSWS